jgi:hypothetical protein
MKNIKKTIASVDFAGLLRKHPVPTLAAATAVGLVVGLTIGSRAMRVLISSVGMMTLTDLARRYVQRAVDDLAPAPNNKTHVARAPQN